MISKSVKISVKSPLIRGNIALIEKVEIYAFVPLTLLSSTFDFLQNRISHAHLTAVVTKKIR